MASAARLAALAFAATISVNFVCAGHSQESWDNVLADRIVFAVDTSASMLMDDLHIKMRQAISVWTKYLSPPSTSIGISQLKLKDGVSMKNVAGSSLKSILPEEDFFGNACLFCGLKEADKVLEDANAKDLVVLLMEERADDMPHDIPQFALQSVQPKFRIFSIALTDKSDPDLEELSNATHGGSDFVPNPTFARLLMSFSSLPVAKDYSFITTKECKNDASCPIEFELDETVANPQSVLEVFMCPTLNRNSSIKLEYDLMNVQLDDGDSVQSLTPEFDLETGCWIYQQHSPQSGIWQLKVGSENNTVSVAVVLQNAHYHTLDCYTAIEFGTVFVKAKIDPPVENLERFDISYVAEDENQIYDSVSMEMDDHGSYSVCMKPTKEIGRHAIACKASKSGVQMLQSQAHSLKIENWLTTENYCPSKASTTAATTKQEPPVEENVWSPSVTTEVTMVEISEGTTVQIESETIAVDKHVNEKINANSTTEGDQESGSGVSSTAQMIIFVVGAIILAEVVFVIVRCRKKANRRERERTQVAYPVDPKVNPERRYQKVRSIDAEESV